MSTEHPRIARLRAEWAEEGVDDLPVAPTQPIDRTLIAALAAQLGRLCGGHYAVTVTAEGRYRVRWGGLNSEGTLTGEPGEDAESVLRRALEQVLHEEGE